MQKKTLICRNDYLTSLGSLEDWIHFKITKILLCWQVFLYQKTVTSPFFIGRHISLIWNIKYLLVREYKILLVMAISCFVELKESQHRFQNLSFKLSLVQSFNFNNMQSTKMPLNFLFELPTGNVPTKNPGQTRWFSRWIAFNHSLCVNHHK